MERPQMQELSTGSKIARPPFRKIAICIAEDWFALSHFKPLITVLASMSKELVVITRSSGRTDEIAALGARIVEFDYRRSSNNPAWEITSVRKLAQVLRIEQADVVHLISMKPIVLGSMASRLAAVRRVVIHMTGLGYLSVSNNKTSRVVRSLAMRLIAACSSGYSTWLLIENPDDLEYLQSFGIGKSGRATILGGAGVDPEEFPQLRLPNNEPPVAATVGRMIRTKGIDITVRAFDILKDRGVPVRVAFYGRLDDGNPEGFSEADIAQMTARKGVNWYGHVNNIASVWAQSDIAVVPSLGGEGLPRTLLEAAACGRPTIVSDVPGCRRFIRDEVDGILVPPGDATALANALERLVVDPELRARFALAARKRVLEGFTETHVADCLRGVYDSLAQERTA